MKMKSRGKEKNLNEYCIYEKRNAVSLQQKEATDTVATDREVSCISPAIG